jgi:hypothetical protein
MSRPAPCACRCRRTPARWRWSPRSTRPTRWWAPPA